MKQSRIILANDSRLLRGLLWRALDKVSGLQIVGETQDLSSLTARIEQAGAEWVILPLWTDGQLPSVLDAVLNEHPEVSLLGLAKDGSAAKLQRSAGSPEELLPGISLDELILTLGGDPSGNGPWPCQEAREAKERSLSTVT